MRKLRVLIVGILVIVAIGVFFWFSNPLGRVVKAAIESLGPDMTQAEVRVGKAIIGEMVKQMALTIPKAAGGSVGAAVKSLFGK